MLEVNKVYCMVFLLTESFPVQVAKAPVPRVYGSRYKKKEHLSIQEQSTHARTCSNIINSARADLAIRGHSNGNMNGHVGMKMRCVVILYPISD